MGRPTKLTPEVQARIVEALEIGHYAEVAARLAGIDEKTYYSWIKRGEADEEPFTGFLQSVKDASARAEDAALKRVHIGTTGDNGVDDKPNPLWQSAMTFLERRFHARWGQRDALYEARGKQMRSDLEKSKVEIETLKQKLEMLKQGINPDGQVINVLIPDALRRDGE